MFFRKALIAAFAFFLFIPFLHADEPEITLDRIVVVTPGRYEQGLSDAASSTTVVSRQDIERSSASNAAELLQSVPGVVVRDFYGNGAKASVDLRGFGDMDMMNTLVMIDGRRVNEVDLSGVDWSQIPLDQIERVEVIRGGGSVLYGDNAVAGVINIITRKGSGKPKFEIGSEFGSYDRNMEKMLLSGSQDKLSYLFSASREGTHGYRNNSFFDAYDYGTKLGYDLTDTLSAHFDSGFHRATYGLPGGISESDMAQFGRRYARYGDDRATDKDYYFMGGLKNSFSGLGELNLDFSYRKKEVKSNLVGGNGGWNPVRLSDIETLGFNPKLTVDRELFGKANTLVTGVDFYRSFYRSDNLSSTDSLSDTSHIRKDSLGGYLQEEFSILDNLSVLGGYRYEAVRYSFNFHDFTGWNPDVDSRTTPNEKAYNAGLNYKYGDHSNAYINFNQSFRFPSVDEFFNGSSLNTALKPQLSKDIEAGLRHNFNKRLHGEISVYRMKVKDELFTDPTLYFGLGATSNYPKTLHQGVDASLNFKAMDNLSVQAGYSYQDPEFSDGSFKGKTIPWVPNHKANIGFRYGFWKNFAWEKKSPIVISSGRFILKAACPSKKWRNAGGRRWPTGP